MYVTNADPINSIPLQTVEAQNGDNATLLTHGDEEDEEDVSEEE